MDWKVLLNNDPRFGGFYQQVTGRPVWPVRVALLSAGAVVIVPLVLIVLAGLMVGLAVYFAGSLIAKAGAWFTGTPASPTAAQNPNGFGNSERDSRGDSGGSSGGDSGGGSGGGGDDLRENVRVIQRP